MGWRMGCSIEAKSVSIIIPTFNGASRIGDCLDALLQQTAGRDVEILVVNDGSTDNTADVVALIPVSALLPRQMPGLQRLAIVAQRKPGDDHPVHR